MSQARLGEEGRRFPAPRARWNRGRFGPPWEAFWYIVPALVVLSAFTLYPVFGNLWLSFYRYTFAGATFLGLAQYGALSRDPVFWLSLENSLFWVVGTLVAQFAIGYVLAVLIEDHLPVGVQVFRTLFFLPMVITPTVIALVFNALLSPDYGGVYGVWLHVLPGVPFPTIFGNPNVATPAVIAVSVWQSTGFFMLLYVAGLSQIPQETREAAYLDGATTWGLNRYVYIPMLRPTHVTLLLLGTIQALQQFALIYLITDMGPANATQILGTYVFHQGFILNNLGYAAAVSIVLFVLSLVLVLVELKLAGGRFTIGGARVES